MVTDIINKINKVIENNSWIIEDINYIKEQLAPVLDNINITNHRNETARGLDIFTTSNLCRAVEAFCGSEYLITEENIIKFFKRLIVGYGTCILGYRFMNKYKHSSFSNTKNLVVSNAKELGMYVWLLDGESKLDFFLEDTYTKELYFFCIIMKFYDVEPKDILNVGTFVYLENYDTGAHNGTTDTIKIKDFSLDWIKSKNLDSGI